MKQGGGFEEGVVLGPLIDGAAVDKVAEHIQDAVAKGAKIAYGGQRLTDMGPNFYRPTVMTGASPDMKLFREETFGPVAPLFRFTAEAEVIRPDTDTEYGLAPSFYTRALSRPWRAAA